MNYTGPGKYRHHKGGEYQVIGLALQEDTLLKWHGHAEGAKVERTFVIYEPLTPGSLLEKREEGFWARDLGDFNAQVERDAGMVPRFTKVGP